MTKGWLPELGDGEPPLYLSIARALAVDVARGRLQPGERLPPQRDLADALGVALGTVTRAYAEAERRGLVQGHGRRGTVVKGGGAPRGLGALVDAGGEIDLAANYPTPSLDPDLGAALKSVAKRPDAGGLLLYPPSQGLPRHREAMAGWLDRHGVPAEPDDVVMTAGAQHGLYVALAALTRPGDEVACEALTFPGARAAADALGLRLLPVPIDADGLRPEAFDKLCRTRPVRALYTIPNLHNPTSAVLPAERREALARIAAKRDVWLIEDDLLRALLPAPPPALAELAPERTVHVTSVSKTIAGGLRVGCALPPRRVREALVQAVQASLIACPALTAEVAAGWIADGSAEKTVSARRREAQARQRRARQVLGELGLTVHTRPESYHYWLELPGGWTSDRFAREARDRGVAVGPAELFAVGERRGPEAVRLALSGPASRETLAKGLSAIAELLSGPPTKGSAGL